MYYIYIIKYFICIKSNNKLNSINRQLVLSTKVYNFKLGKKYVGGSRGRVFSLKKEELSYIQACSFISIDKYSEGFGGLPGKT